jgi:hypothetical protein
VRLLAIACCVLGACGPRVVRAPAPPAGDELTLYRDRAVVRTRFDVTVPEADKATIALDVPAGVDVDDIVVLDHGELTVTPVTEPARPDAKVRFTVAAPHAGRYPLALGYTTDQIQWDAAYTLTTTPARTSATVRGAIAIRNGTGRSFEHVRLSVVDKDVGSLRALAAEQQARPAATRPPPGASAPSAVRRELGTLTLPPGELRLALLTGDRPRPMRSVLVYDPIGTKLDHSGPTPIRDPELGAGPASPRVDESLEIRRPAPTSEGLPGGPARLFEQRADGTLVLIGESRLFDVATSVAAVDIVELATADGVTGRRERGDFTIDDDRRRLVEELTVTIANTRARPIDVVVREHLYRGQNWALGYYTAREAKKDGAQQVSMRLHVPAKGEAKLFYVVVYTWN